MKTSNSKPPKKPRKGARTTPQSTATPPPGPSIASAVHDTPEQLKAHARDRAATLPPSLDPIPAERLRLALEFVLKACPKKGDDAVVIFDEDAHGATVIAAHDTGRCHEAFLPLGCAFEARGASAPRLVRKLVKLLKSVETDDEATVTVSAFGRAEVRRTGQPTPNGHELNPEPRMGGWRPPSDAAAAVTSLPLALASDHLRSAVHWPDGTVQIEYRTSARAIVNITVGSESVARATLGEGGHALYEPAPEPPPRQGRLPIDAGEPRSVREAVDGLRRLATAGTSIKITAGGKSVTLGGTGPAHAQDAPVAITEGQVEP